MTLFRLRGGVSCIIETLCTNKQLTTASSSSTSSASSSTSTSTSSPASPSPSTSTPSSSASTTPSSSSSSSTTTTPSSSSTSTSKSSSSSLSSVRQISYDVILMLCKNNSANSSLCMKHFDLIRNMLKSIKYCNYGMLVMMRMIPFDDDDVVMLCWCWSCHVCCEW